jgi:glycerol uptake facilitator-like aquaporin
MSGLSDLNVKEIAIELVGTGAFVAAIMASRGQPVVIGATLALVVFLGNMLGSTANHVNPAITLGLLINGKIKGLRAAMLVIAQLIGAAISILLVTKFLRTEAGSQAAKQIRGKTGMDIKRT